MARGDVREYVLLECEECGNRNYSTSKKVKGATYKLNLKKYCKYDRKHTKHKELDTLANIKVAM